MSTPPTAAAPPEPLLVVDGLRTVFPTDGGVVRAVDDVSFRLHPHETLGLVGESGCGKSVTALSVMRLVDPPGVVRARGILWRGTDLLSLSERAMRRIRGGEISMIFQEPMTSLNPVFTVGEQIIEAVRLHQEKSRDEARAIAVDMLRRVGISNPDRAVDRYPHQMSGGMKQRVMIAMALACRPSLLIADEPTTALDVTIQAQILDLLRDLQRDLGAALLFITHDMGIIAEMAHRVAVMYAGRIVESAPVREIFANPLHPYTRGLLACVPTVAGRKERLQTIPGTVPDLAHLPPGCAFRPRCPVKAPESETTVPELREVAPGHFVACHNY